ncbi:MAG: DUF1761 domain-containing protein [Patescibacteria group bacterium]
MLPTVNYLAVVVAAVASMAIGFAWYSMPVFGKPWVKLLGLTQEALKKSQKEMGPKYGIMVLASLLMAFVLAVLVKLAWSQTAIGGAKVGALAWLGFVATVGLNSFVFENKPFQLYLINVAYYLVSLVVMGAILAAWV